MSSDLAPGRAGDPDVDRRRAALLVPTIIATCVGGALLGLSLLVHVIAELLVASDPGWLPDGMTYLPPSGSERAAILGEQAAPVVAAVVLLTLTWRFRDHGRTAATILCAVAGVLVAASTLR